MSTTIQLKGNSQTSERRRHWRQRVLYSAAELGKDNGGIILNISETGAALQAVSELDVDELPTMRFQFSRTKTWIETKGRIVWKSESKRTAGVEFVDLPDKSREEIQDWITFTSDGEFIDLSGTLGVAEAKVPEAAWDKIRVKLDDGPAIEDPIEVAKQTEGQEKQPVVTQGSPSAAQSLTLFPQDAQPNQAVTGHEVTHNLPKERSWVGLFTMIVLLVITFVLLALSLRRAFNRPLNENKDVEAPTALPPVSSNSPSNSVSATPNTGNSSDGSGFVLQVGAMKAEKNAFSLADVLRQKNFQVFIAKSATDSFYRVMVGPFSDAASAATGQADLEKQGFRAIRKRNKTP